MATDEWMTYGEIELINLARTTTLAQVLGIDTVIVDPATVQWVENALAESDDDYADVEQAPWYDAEYPASAEFAGLVPLSFTGISDSSLEADTTENIGKGGSTYVDRFATKTIVANVLAVGSTYRGVEYGKRWLDKMLRAPSSGPTRSGATLTYFRFPGDTSQPVPPKAHLRLVRTTRGTSVTRRRTSDCSSSWMITFTLTANDPIEYGEAQPQFTGLGSTSLSGPAVVSSGSLALTDAPCPAYDYTPVYDPMYPALIAPPTAPDFYPNGWQETDGATFDRFWVRLEPSAPVELDVVPVLTLQSDEEARMVRVSVWPADAEPNDLCGALWTAVATYLPPTVQLTIDGEREAVYVWDGHSPLVRRADTLVFGGRAEPIPWRAFNDPLGLMVTLDLFSDSDAGAEPVLASMQFVPKSD